MTDCIHSLVASISNQEHFFCKKCGKEFVPKETEENCDCGQDNCPVFWRKMGRKYGKTDEAGEGKDYYTKAEIDPRFAAISELCEKMMKWAQDDDERMSRAQDLSRKGMKLEEKAWRKALLDFLWDHLDDEVKKWGEENAGIAELRRRFL